MLVHSTTVSLSAENINDSATATTGSALAHTAETCIMDFMDLTESSRRSVANAIGRSVKSLRQARGMTQRELAVALAPYLPAWTHDTVAATEIGRREPSLGEALALVTLFRCSMGDLLSPEGGDIYVGSKSVQAAVEGVAPSVWDIDTGPEGWALARLAELGIEYSDESFAGNLDVLSELPPKPSGPGDPDHFAAKKFGVDLGDIEAIAESRYGHSLYAERWRRECLAVLRRSSLPPEVLEMMPKRSSKGERIGISRSLMAEIEGDAVALVAKRTGPPTGFFVVPPSGKKGSGKYVRSRGQEKSPEVQKKGSLT